MRVNQEGPRRRRGNPNFNPQRLFWGDRFNLTRKARHVLTGRTIAQLQACKDDDARKVLLGISE